jgi:hypothetical protein
MGAASSVDGEAPFVASLIWSALHGLVMLCVSRPTFPWAPLDQMVDETVLRLIGSRVDSGCGSRVDSGGA